MFAATVMDGKAFFHGGISSSNTPIPGSAFHVVDLHTLAPVTMQVPVDSTLVTARYRHQLVHWNDKLLIVGGQQDDSSGNSVKVLNIIELDLNTRSWILVKEFTQPGGAVEIIFDVSVVAGDFLFIAFQRVDPVDPGWQFLRLNLKTQEVDPQNFWLYRGVKYLEYPLVAVLPLSADGDWPQLVVQAARQLPNAAKDMISWLEVVGPDSGDLVTDPETNETSSSGIFGPRATKVAAGPGMNQLKGGTGGKVLNLNILPVLGKHKLVLWALTKAAFASAASPLDVSVLTVYDISIPQGGKRRQDVSLTLSNIFLGAPLGAKATDVRSIDLPLHGNMTVPPAAVTPLPYVGKVDLISDLDSSNVNIQSAGDTLVIRGLEVATGVVRDAIRTGGGFHRIGDGPDAALLVLAPQTMQSSPFSDLITDAPLRGAYISMMNNSIDNFTVPASKDYPFPAGVSSCVTLLGGRHTYLEQGGWYFDQEGKRVVSPGAFAVNVQPGQQHTMVTASGNVGKAATVYGSMACLPNGQVYTFGGLVIAEYSQLFEGDPTEYAIWQPTSRLHKLQLKQGAGRFSLEGPQEMKPQQRGVAPANRSGHAMVYLPAETVSKQGMSQGALLLYGGSDLVLDDQPDTSFLSQLEEAKRKQELNGSSWDTAPWLFDIGRSQWQRLTPDGEGPPGLMYPSMAVHGEQVMLFGGLAYSLKELTVSPSTDLFVLDFSEAQPFWRRAPVANINKQGADDLAFPNAGVVPLPAQCLVALQHRSGISVASIPQSIALNGSAAVHWGLTTINLTAGDGVRLAAGPDPQLSLLQPLLIAGGFVVSGVGRPAVASGRHLLQAAGPNARLKLRCSSSNNMSSAFLIT
eukprot:gene9585-9748_t